MTNYNERLDKILSYEHNVEGCQALHSGSKCLHCDEDPCPHCKRWGGRQRTEVRSMVDKKTKQAFTSLIKELVEEAKPEKRTPDYYSDSIDLYSRQCAANSRNKAIDEFEQNLLKALEEV